MNNLLACDASQSPLGVAASSQRSMAAYDPYGYRPSQPDAPVVSFNGQRAEAGIERYHLGHGRRVYNPVLRRFHEQDALSPFGAGGLNGYMYCAGDPVNYGDPSGASLDWLHGDAAKYLIPLATIFLNGLGIIKNLAVLGQKGLPKLTTMDRVLALKTFITAPLSIAGTVVGMAKKNDEAILIGLSVGVLGFVLGGLRTVLAAKAWSGLTFKANIKAIFGKSVVPPAPVELIRMGSIRPASAGSMRSAGQRAPRGSMASGASLPSGSTRHSITSASPSPRTSGTKIRQN